MSIKLFSFLGTNDYKEIIYCSEKIGLNKNNYKKFYSQYIQLSLCNLLKEKNEDFTIYMCLTQMAIEKNYEPKDSIGLKRLLDDNNIKHKEIDFLDGKNKDELYENFDKIYENIENGDEIYVDITHSFRSIPLIFMSVLNYAVVTKNVKLRKIYYGAYESRSKMDIDGDEFLAAPIFDLTLFNNIQDWTRASEKFLTTGDSKLLALEIEKISTIIAQDIKDDKCREARDINRVSSALRKYSHDILNCRGRELDKTPNYLREKIKGLKNISIKELKPFVKIIDQIYDNIKYYSGDIVRDSLFVVEQCINFGLIPQGFTILRENIITFVARNLDLDYEKYEDRNNVEGFLFNCKPKIKIEARDLEMYTKFMNNIKLQKEELEEISLLFDEIRQYRNSINHNGFSRDNPSSNKFSIKLKEFTQSFFDILNKTMDKLPKEEVKNIKKVLPILSHTLTENQILDLENNHGINEIVNLPNNLKEKWANIEPEGELDDNLADDIIQFIEDNTCEQDYILIQGEFGMTFYLVNSCFNLNRIPIYATSKRSVKEEKEGNKIITKRVFEHVGFRKYRR